MGQTCCSHPTTEERLSESTRTNSKGEEVQQQHSSATTSGTTLASSSVVEQDKMEACREFAGLPLPPVADVKFSRSPGVAHTKREDGNHQRRARGISSPIVELDQVGISSRSNSNSAVQVNSLGHAIVLGGEHQPLKLASPTSAECRPECGTNLPDDGNENPDPIMRSVGYAANEPGKTEMDAKIKTIILRAELTMALEEDDENEEEDWSMAPPPQGRSTTFRQQYQEQQSGGNLIGVLATGNSTAPHNRVSFPKEQELMPQRTSPGRQVDTNTESFGSRSPNTRNDRGMHHPVLPQNTSSTSITTQQVASGSSLASLVECTSDGGASDDAVDGRIDPNVASGSKSMHRKGKGTKGMKGSKTGSASASTDNLTVVPGPCLYSRRDL